MKAIKDVRIEPSGKASFLLNSGEYIRIVNIEGPQVVDLWAFNRDDVSEYLSTEHTRSCLQKLIPAVGDYLYSNKRREIISIVEDTSAGVHDMLLSACDLERYALLGHSGYHKNCCDNLRDAMEIQGHIIVDIPSPLNVFENVFVGENGALEIEPPLVEVGQYITFKAEIPILLVLSACPMDMALTNGFDKKPKPALIQVLQ